MERDVGQGIRAAVAAYTLWGLLTLYWKQLEGLDAVEMIGWRMATAAVFMSLVVTLTGRWQRVASAFRRRSTVARIGWSSVLLTLNWTIYVWSVVNDRVIETALGYFLAPLFTMAIGVFVLGERLTRLKIGSIIFAVGAVAVLTASYGSVPWVAVGLATSWSWYGLTKRRVPLDPIESLTSETLVALAPALVLVASGWWRTDGIPDTAAGADWAFLVGTGVITAIPLLLFAYAAQRVPFTILGPTNYLVPIINFGLGWLVFDEPLPPSRIAGFALVWVALALVTVDTARSTASRRGAAPLPLERHRPDPSV